MPSVCVSSCIILILTLTKIIILNGAKSAVRDEKLAVHKYQHVFYDPSQLKLQHRGIKRHNRSIFRPESSFLMNLNSEENNYKIKLAVDKCVFHPEVVFENSRGSIYYDTTRTLSGHLQGERDSVVHGILSSNGHFNGYVFSNGTEYYMESSRRYFSITNKSQGVIYRTQDIKWHSEKMRSKDYVILKQDSDNISKTFQIKDFKEKSIPLTRSKRSGNERKRQVCTLFIQADYSFYKHFGSESACIDVIAQHVQKANEIYLSTDIDSDGTPGELSFMIKRVKVETHESAAQKLNFSVDGIAEPLLGFSMNKDYSSFCLAYLFTMENLGDLAGQALTPSNFLLEMQGLIIPGICADAKRHYIHQGLFYNASVNVGIVTLFSNNKTTPPTMSHLTFAHELTHSLGSPHDPEDDDMCSPGGEDGNYLMATSRSGQKKNNKILSPCTINSIKLIYLFYARAKPGCLTEMEDQQGICGNGVVEEGEECDCGWEEDCKESCCFPMKMTSSESEIPCKLKPQANCSPSQGRCCAENCTLSFGTMCQDVNKCIEEAVCDGKSPICPSTNYKSDTATCDKNAICLSGECYPTEYVCYKFGLQRCVCQSESDEMSSSHCELCCKLPGINSSCISSFKWNEAPFNIPDMYTEPEFPCKKFTGTCDAQHICRVTSLKLVQQEVIIADKPLIIILIVLLIFLLILSLFNAMIGFYKKTLSHFV